MANYYEVVQNRTLNQVEKDEWTGTRTFLCHDWLVGDISRSLWDNVFPAITGGFAPRVCKTAATFEPYGVNDVALIVAYYRTKLVPGKAIIHTRASYRPRRALVDVDGKIVEGPENSTTDTHMKEWQVVQGNNIWLDTTCEFRVQTAIARSDYSDENLMAIQNTVNASNFNIRGYAAAGTLLFKGFDSIDRYSQDPIKITYYFGYDKNGWNNSVKSQLGTWKLEQKLVYDTSGTSLGQYRTVKVFHPGKNTDGTDTTPESRKLFVPASWNAIKDSASW